MLFIIFILFSIFLVNSNNLLLSLLVLEMIGFFIIYYVALNLSIILDFDFLVLSLFAVFVMEGVIALSGLIIVVSFSGSDYVSSSSFSNL